MSQVALARKYSISRRELYNIIENRENIIQFLTQTIQNNFSLSQKRIKVIIYESRIDKAVWFWFEKSNNMIIYTN